MEFTTVFKAVDNLDGELKTWFGPNVKALTWGMAEQYLIDNKLTYLNIHGKLHSELPEEDEGLNNETIYHTDN